jgi:hypothetical protein
MKRPLMIVALLAILLTPLLAAADDQGWMPPEWNPIPPAQPSVDLVQLVRLLEAKGVISDQEYAQLLQPRLPEPAGQEQIKEWTWDEVDYNPVLRAGRSGGD